MIPPPLGGVRDRVVPADVVLSRPRLAAAVVSLAVVGQGGRAEAFGHHLTDLDVSRITRRPSGLRCHGNDVRDSAAVTDEMHYRALSGAGNSLRDLLGIVS